MATNTDIDSILAKYSDAPSEDVGTLDVQNAPDIDGILAKYSQQDNAPVEEPMTQGGISVGELLDKYRQPEAEQPAPPSPSLTAIRKGDLSPTDALVRTPPTPPPAPPTLAGGGVPPSSPTTSVTDYKNKLRARLQADPNDEQARRRWDDLLKRESGIMESAIDVGRWEGAADLGESAYKMAKAPLSGLTMGLSDIALGAEERALGLEGVGAADTTAEMIGMAGLTMLGGLATGSVMQRGLAQAPGISKLAGNPVLQRMAIRSANGAIMGTTRAVSNLATNDNYTAKQAAGDIAQNIFSSAVSVLPEAFAGSQKIINGIAQVVTDFVVDLGIDSMRGRLKDQTFGEWFVQEELMNLIPSLVGASADMTNKNFSAEYKVNQRRFKDSIKNLRSKGVDAPTSKQRAEAQVAVDRKLEQMKPVDEKTPKAEIPDEVNFNKANDWESDFLFHLTTPRNAARIRAEGLNPSERSGKLFLLEELDDSSRAMFDEAERMRVINDPNADILRDGEVPEVIAVHRSDVGELTEDPRLPGYGAFTTTKAIPPDRIYAESTDLKSLVRNKTIKEQPYQAVRKVAKADGIDVSDNPTRTEMAERIARQNATTPPPSPMVDDPTRVNAEFVRDVVSDPKKGRIGNFITKWFGTPTSKATEIAMEQKESDVRSAMYEAELDNQQLKQTIKQVYGKTPKVDDILQINKVLSGDADAETLPPEIRPLVATMRARVDGLSRQIKDMVVGRITAKIGERGDLLLEKGWTPEDAIKRAAKDSGDVKISKIESDQDALVEFVASNLRAGKDMDEATSRLMAQDILAQQARSGKMGEIEAVWRQAKTIEDNIGSYLNRSYRAFDDPKYAQKVITDNPELVARVANKFMDEAERGGAAISREEAVKQVEAMLVNVDGHPIDALMGKKTSASDLGIMMQRKLDDVDIQKLFGRYDDPSINYLRSVSKMASFIASTKMEKAIIENGLGEGMISVKEQGDQVYKVNLGGKEFYADKPTADAFNEFQDSGHSFQNAKRLVAAVKWSKTIGSIPGQIRNFMANPKLLIRQGILDPRRLMRTIGALTTNRSQFDARIKEWYDTGMIGEGVRSGELREMIQWITKNDVDISDITPTRNPKTGKIDPVVVGKKIPRTIANALAKSWELGDSIFKVTAYEAEKERYRAANPDWTDAQVKERAMEIAKQTLPTYSRSPKIVELIRKNPFVGTFPSFAAEIIRTEVNTAKLAWSEINDANPAIRAIGKRRAAGAVLNHALSLAVPAIANMMFGGVSKEEEEDARRTIVPPWSKNSSLAWLSKGDEWSWMDLSFSDPMAIIHNPIRGAYRAIKDAAKEPKTADKLSKGTLNAIGEFAKELGSPFIATDIVTKRVAQAYSNADEFGRPIYNTEAPASEQAAMAAWHILKETVPATFTQLNRVYKGATDQMSRSGRKYDLKDELMSLGGVRVNRMSPTQALMFSSYNHKKRWETIRQNYSSDVANRAASQGDLQSGMNTYQNSFDNWTSEFKKDLDAFRRMGVSEYDIRKRIDDMRLPKDVRRYIIQGGGRKPVPDMKFLPAQRRAELRALERNRQ